MIIFSYKHKKPRGIRPPVRRVSRSILVAFCLLMCNQEIDNIHDCRNGKHDDRDGAHESAVFPGRNPFEDNGVHPEGCHHHGKDNTNPVPNLVALELNGKSISHQEHKGNNDLHPSRNEVHHEFEDTSEYIRTCKAQYC